MSFPQLCYCVPPAEETFSAGFLNEINNPAESIMVPQARMSLDTYSLEQFLKQVEKRAYRMAHIATSNVDDADRKSTRLNSSHTDISRMPSSA